MSIRKPLSLLMIGEIRSTEFRELADSLRRCNAKSAANVDDAIDQIQSGFAPAVIILAQRWPGDVSVRQMHALQREAPLARIVRLLGSWLEGEARTGRPLPALLRAYWHQALPRIGNEIDKLLCDKPSVFARSTTSDDGERLWHGLAARSGRHDAERTSIEAAMATVAVFASNRERASAIIDDCRHLGCGAGWIRFEELAVAAEPSLAVFDSQRLADADFSQIAQLRALWKQSPIAVVAGFARFDDAERLRSVGADALITKPYYFTDFAQQIRSLVAPAS